MKKLLFVSLIVLLNSCGSINKSIDSSFLFKNQWVVQSILGEKVDAASFGNGLPFVEFIEDGKVAGFDGCNRFNGNLNLAASEFSFGPLASTRMMCPRIDSDLFIKTLNQVTGYTKKGEVLELTGETGSLLTFLPTNNP